MRRKLFAFAWLFVVPVALYACANDDNAAPGPKDHSKDPPVVTGDTGTGETSAEASTDTGVPLEVQKCKQADFDAPASANGGDLTGQASVTITFPMGAAPLQYTNRCSKVKVGATVNFVGSFSNHPLVHNGGDVGSQIPNTNTDQPSNTISFTTAAMGTFGFNCSFHPGDMFGAIQVVNAP